MQVGNPYRVGSVGKTLLVNINVAPDGGQRGGDQIGAKLHDERVGMPCLWASVGDFGVPFQLLQHLHHYNLRSHKPVDVKSLQVTCHGAFCALAAKIPPVLFVMAGGARAGCGFIRCPASGQLLVLWDKCCLAGTPRFA